MELISIGELPSLDKLVVFRSQASKESEYVNDITYLKAKELAVFYDNKEDYHAFMLMDAKVVVGNLFMKIKTKESILHIELICVLEAYYGTGAASMLMDKAVAIAEENKLDFLQLNVAKKNDRAMQFYQKKGFTEKKELNTRAFVYERPTKLKAIKTKPKPLYRDWK
jgi:ribosomal protein S18 acetylase RimI-like enzyme